MRRLLKPVLSRWEIDPPLIGAEEAYGELKPIFESLCERSLLRPATPAGSHTCCECGERRRVDYLPSKGGGQAGFIHCQCGVTPVPEEALLQFVEQFIVQQFEQREFFGIQQQFQRSAAPR